MGHGRENVRRFPSPRGELVKYFLQFGRGLFFGQWTRDWHILSPFFS
jgi:hypothetical protein